MADFHHPSRKLTFFDGLTVVLLLLAAIISAGAALSREAGTTCTILSDQRSETFFLSENRVIPVSSGGHSLTVTILDGTVAVTASDCPDGVCVNSGTISRSGQAVVCVPAQVTIRIDGTPDSGTDAVAGGFPR